MYMIARFMSFYKPGVTPEEGQSGAQAEGQDVKGSDSEESR